MDIIVITNGPGELATWVSSTVKILEEQSSNMRISIFLPPCPFASGEEEKIARTISGVSVVLNPKNFIKFLIWGKTKEFSSSNKGLVVFLGGDILHAILVAKRTGFPAIAYTVRPYFFNRFFSYCLVSDEKVKNQLINSGIKEDVIKVVGNLLLEGIKINYSREEAREKWGLSENTFTLGLMPGSRNLIFRLLLPYYLKVAEQITSEIDVQYLLALSPHISIKILRETLLEMDNIGETSECELKEDERGYFIQTEGNVIVRIVQNMQYDVINLCDLVLCLPGTITAETAFFGVPMIVCYSKTRPEIVPLGGLPAFLERIPFVGMFLKKYIVKYFIFHKYGNSVKYLSIPNMMAEKEIVPEIEFFRYAEEISKPILELIRDKEKRSEISEALQSLFNRGDAGRKVASIILKTMESI